MDFSSPVLGPTKVYNKVSMRLYVKFWLKKATGSYALKIEVHLLMQVYGIFLKDGAFQMNALFFDLSARCKSKLLPCRILRQNRTRNCKLTFLWPNNCYSYLEGDSCYI